MKFSVAYSDDYEKAFYCGATFNSIGNGYYRCSQRNHARGYLLHRFIYETERGTKIPTGYNVHHKDGDKLNNNVENLECIRASAHTKLHNSPEKVEKCISAMKVANKERNFPGVRASQKVQRANNYPSLRKSNEKRRKPILMYSIEMELIQKFDSLLDAARHIEKPPTHISQCANMKRNTAFGFVWRWKDEITYAP